MYNFTGIGVQCTIQTREFDDQTPSTKVSATLARQVYGRRRKTRHLTVEGYKRKNGVKDQI